MSRKLCKLDPTKQNLLKIKNILPRKRFGALRTSRFCVAQFAKRPPFFYPAWYGLYLLIKKSSCGILIVCSISDEKQQSKTFVSRYFPLLGVTSF